MDRDTGLNQARQPQVVAGSSFAIIAALVLGVGLSSHLVLRHLVQTLPSWIVGVLGLRGSRAAGWAGLPTFLFWLFLMTEIWLYLLGISNLLSGHFTRTEIGMTFLVGLASALGTIAFFRLRSNLSAWYGAAIFVVIALFQIICFRVSLLPAIAHH